MQKTLTGTVAEVSNQSITLALSTGETVALPVAELLSELKSGDPIWLTISSDPPSDAKEILNTVLGA